MCGIAGVIDTATPPERELLLRMAAPLAKRGPDDEGIFAEGRVGLAFRRLSIIDLVGGNQPMFCADRSLALVFNGEIYNFLELRAELEARGHVFRTRSDSEVLLHMYEDKGPKMVHDLNGMFAFAICHIPSGDLFLARDRIGQKPLFYAQAGGRMAFASGPASLACLDWVDTEIDRSAINDYLEYQYIPTPRSIYRGVSKLPPGCTATWRNGELKIHHYWTPDITADSRRPYSEVCEDLSGRLDTAVKRRLVADVPVGIFLSGGVDSSLISALATRHVDGQAKTFSIGFPEAKYDEREFAKLVAAHLGTDHHFLEVRPDSLDTLERVVSDFEEPFCDASMLPMFLLSDFARGSVTVALSGDGADELFGGYYRYRVMHLARMCNVLPRALRRTAASVLERLLPPRTEERTFSGRLRRILQIGREDGLERYLRLISRCPPGLKQRIYGDRMISDGPLPDTIGVLQEHLGSRDVNDINSIMNTELKTYLNDDILVKVDRASMACGLEVRSPFLDPMVVELAMTMPFSWKQRGRTRKRILRDTFGGLLPKQIFTRPKLGFGVPLAAWLRQEWEKPAKMLLLDGALARDGYFRRDALEGLIADHVNMKTDNSYVVFALMVLALWMESNCKTANERG